MTPEGSQHTKANNLHAGVSPSPLCNDSRDDLRRSRIMENNAERASSVIQKPSGSGSKKRIRERRIFQGEEKLLRSPERQPEAIQAVENSRENNSLMVSRQNSKAPKVFEETDIEPIKTKDVTQRLYEAFEQ